MLNACPLHNELARFSIGQLAELPAEEIATHVDSCAKCRTVLEELSSATQDSLAAAMRQPGELPFSGEAALAAALPRVQALAEDRSALSELNTDSGPPTAALSVSHLQAIRDYEILEKLGEGGMGAVYKARHRRLKKIVALKVLPSDRMLGAEAIARFEREMEAVGKLEHPNLVRAMDAGEADGTHFLVMEYVGGPDLSQLVKRNSPLSIADACELIRQAAVGLQHVHEQGLVHRDIKPSNLMLSPNGTLKVLDLGLALLAGDASPTGPELTTTGQMMGTLDYMAPEQGGDTHHVDIRADIYSLGASLYKLLTGVAPFGDPKFDTPVKKLMALATQEPTPIHDRRPDVPPALADIIDRMLAKSPANRYETPAQVAADLAPFAEGANLPALLDRVPNDGSSRAVEMHSTLRTVSLATQPKIQEYLATQSTARRHALAPLGIAIGLALLALLAAVVFYVPTRYGSVKVTINDPNVTVKFGSTGATILGADDKPIDLKFGDQEIEIKRGDFRFTTTRFKLEKRGLTTLDVELLPGELKVVYDGQLIERKSLAIDPPPSTLAANSTSADPRYVLQFDDRTDTVDLSAVTYDGTYDLTIEGWFQTLEPGHCEFLRFEPDGPILFALVKDGERNIAAEWTSAEGKQVYAVCINRLKVGEVQHVAIVYRRERMLVFVDGVPIAESEVKFKPGVDRKLKLGNAIMNLHALRVSRGTRYAQPFQPEKSLVTDADTLANYRCDEGTGIRLNDSSGKGRHGLLAGPKWARLGTPPNVARTQELSANYALEFDGRASHVIVPTLRPETKEPLTIETHAWFSPELKRATAVASAYSPTTALLLARGDQGSPLFLARHDLTTHASGLTGEVKPREWVHLAGVWDGEKAQLYVQGKAHPGYQRQTIPAQLAAPQSQHLVLGAEFGIEGNPLVQYFQGQLDELRISLVARYKSDFVAPRPGNRFVPDQHTLALYHFDEGQGEVLQDSSGNEYHGKIIDAKWVRIVDGPTVNLPRPEGRSTLDFNVALIDGTGRVESPDVLNPSEPCTVEFYITPRSNPTQMKTNRLLFGMGSSLMLVQRHNGWRWHGPAPTDRVSAGLTTAMKRVHLAVTSDNRELRIYEEGKLKGKLALTVEIQSGVSSGMIGGQPRTHDTWEPLDAVIDQFRYSTKVRYDEDFEPEPRMSADADTLILYNFEEGAGEQVKDSSGHGNHGRIFGAKWVRLDAHRAPVTNAAPALGEPSSRVK